MTTAWPGSPSHLQTEGVYLVVGDLMHHEQDQAPFAVVVNAPGVHEHTWPASSPVRTARDLANRLANALNHRPDPHWWTVTVTPGPDATSASVTLIHRASADDTGHLVASVVVTDEELVVRAAAAPQSLFDRFDLADIGTVVGVLVVVHARQHRSTHRDPAHPPVRVEPA